MARIEKAIFISYRRTDVYTALAVYENLKNQGYDVFFDYRSISSGDFEQIISSNIRARAHFLLILTPTALDRCNEPGDWLRREIEIAMDEKRNIIPLFFKGFRFGNPSVNEKLTGKLKNLGRYNGLNVHEDYFDEAMRRLRTQYLNIPLETVLHPVSTEVQKVVREEQVAADKALEQIEDVKELVKQAENKARFEELEGELALSSVPRSEPNSPNTIPWRSFGLVLGGLLIVGFIIWAASRGLQNLPIATPEATFTSRPQQTNIPAQTQIPSTPAFSIGSTMISEKDGMTLVHVPAGEFTMGSDNGASNEKPVHQVTLDAFWIDKTEVTVRMYSLCVQAGVCNEPISKESYTHSSYYGNAEFDNYPVIYVDWNMAKTYCEWVERRLPTEAEWEKAARGTDARTYPWGNDAPNNNLLNYLSAVGDTTEVGKYSDGTSPYGVLDMAGNVWEWVADWYDVYPGGDPNADSYFGQKSRVLRGGSWDSSGTDARSAIRYGYFPAFAYNYIGFRCAMDATP